MADELYLIRGETLTEIADAIRAKTGLHDNLYFVDSFASAIQNLQTSSGDSSGSEGETASNFVCDETYRGTAGNTFNLSCSFEPSKLILWNLLGDGYSGDEEITTFIYNSSAENEEFLSYVYSDSKGAMLIDIGSTSDTDPKYILKLTSDNTLRITVSTDYGTTFRKGTWYYIAIA